MTPLKDGKLSSLLVGTEDIDFYVREQSKQKIEKGSYYDRYSYSPKGQLSFELTSTRGAAGMMERPSASRRRLVSLSPARCSWETMSPFFGLLRKTVFYQRTAQSSKTITMCSTNIPARTRRQLII
jgi:hypothetical protein